MRPLSMRESLACVDDQGRVRCPSCGRFSKMENMSRDNTIVGSGVIVSMFPRCPRCRKNEESR